MYNLKHKKNPAVCIILIALPTGAYIFTPDDEPLRGSKYVVY
jgi:hypothetical protein